MEITREEVKRVKEKLSKEYRGQPWFNGMCITKTKNDEFCIIVRYLAGQMPPEIETIVDGVKIKWEESYPVYAL